MTSYLMKYMDDGVREGGEGRRGGLLKKNGSSFLRRFCKFEVEVTGAGGRIVSTFLWLMCPKPQQVPQCPPNSQNRPYFFPLVPVSTTFLDANSKTLKQTTSITVYPYTRARLP
ncbi:hypothetical protein L596_020140 [Steinernema carpocapsae]|uniref:Uncharacterized protein n=1 Tax=Steinernema carpocapsae TaxID=34508 RepID=A0A4U5MSS5_STECR|nr:hypothetical protein L596_020140 [Steinernema carpocapsae]